jgi:hypothetical protein
MRESKIIMTFHPNQRSGATLYDVMTDSSLKF